MSLDTLGYKAYETFHVSSVGSFLRYIIHINYMNQDYTFFNAGMLWQICTETIHTVLNKSKSIAISTKIKQTTSFKDLAS